MSESARTAKKNIFKGNRRNATNLSQKEIESKQLKAFMQTLKDKNLHNLQSTMHDLAHELETQEQAVVFME